VAQQVGSSRPLYCTAAGKVQLAFVEPQRQLDLLSGSELKSLTARTITDHERLKIELLTAAQNGYAIDDQEHDDGVMEIAAPVFDSDGAVIGALSILGPEMRLAGTRLENELLPLLCQGAARLSTVLGYRRTAEPGLPPLKPKLKTKKPEAEAHAFGGIRSLAGVVVR
jgi:DNA-binding IclR family transcriptional regulator